jgi:hypothetical protein
MPDFGLHALGVLLHGERAKDEFDGPGADGPKRTAVATVLRVLLIVGPMLMMAAIWYNGTRHLERAGGDTYEVYPPLFRKIGVWETASFGAAMLISGVASFDCVWVVTHPTSTVERVAGASYITTRGHLARLLSENGNVPRSTAERLSKWRRAFTRFYAPVVLVLTAVLFLPTQSDRHKGRLAYYAICAASALLVWMWSLFMGYWMLSLKIATEMTSIAMCTRAEQAGTLAATSVKPPKAYTIFASMRFPVPDEARQLQRELAKAGLIMHIVEMQAGADISDEVFEWIEHADTFLVFGTQHYGEDTGNPASSCAEAKYAQNQGKRMILIRMIPWEQEFEHLQARVMFGMNRLTLEWQLGEPMPLTLSHQIVNALDLDEVLSTSSGLRGEGSRPVVSTDRVSTLKVRGGIVDDTQWRAVVESPILKLANSTLPTLSAGWGKSFALVWFSFVVFFVTILSVSIETKVYNGFGYLIGRDILSAALWLFALCLAMSIPVYLGLIAAQITDGCKRLENGILAYCVEDLRMHRVVHPLITTLRSQNGGQGLGFVAGGLVVSRWTVFISTVTTYFAAAVAIAFVLIGQSESVHGFCSAANQQHMACAFGWTYADGSCYRMFGDAGHGQAFSWLDAKQACARAGRGTFLATITSVEQQEAVDHIVRRYTLSQTEKDAVVTSSGVYFKGVWIGLNDEMQDGKFTWASGEPFELSKSGPGSQEYYANFAATEPNAMSVGAVCMRSMNGDPVTWADHDIDEPSPYLCSSMAMPSAATGGDMLGCTGGRWAIGKPYKQPDSETYGSMRLPRTIVSTNPALRFVRVSTPLFLKTCCCTISRTAYTQKSSTKVSRRPALL